LEPKNKVTASPIHEYDDRERKIQYEHPYEERNIAPKNNQSMEYYKQKAIEDARNQHMSSKNNSPGKVRSKEIYRTPGYVSRDNSPNSKKGYGADYK